jgi:hypothetical protein
VLQDFKLSSFVTMLTGTRNIAVALTPAKGRALHLLLYLLNLSRFVH